MQTESWQDWFEKVWAFREENLYRSLFGDIGPGIYPLDEQLFTGQFRQSSVDPRWLTHGVFECPPQGNRQSWLYVSSGLSNAWDAESPNPDGVSGLGCEFIMESPSQARWALLFLRRMLAFQILLAAGRFPGKNPLAIWDRIPLRSAIDGQSSALTWVLLIPSPGFAQVQQLPSGRFHFLQFVGITENEANFARTEGGNKLLALLTQKNAAPVTDPTRRDTLSDS